MKSLIKLKTAGVDTLLGETQIQSLTQGIQNQKAIEQLTKIQSGIAEIEQELKEESYDDVLNSIRYNVRIAERQLNLLKVENIISSETMEEKIGIVQGELIGIGLANALKKEQIKLTEEQTKQTVASVSQAWKSLSIQEKNMLINLANSETMKKNAQTNVREFIERARDNQFGNQIQKESLEFLTQKRSPAIPLMKTFPLVAPYNATFPIILFSLALKVELLSG